MDIVLRIKYVHVLEHVREVLETFLPFVLMYAMHVLMCIWNMFRAASHTMKGDLLLPGQAKLRRV